MSGVVRKRFGHEPAFGRCVYFFSTGAGRMKLMVWEEGGFAVYYKRLERVVLRYPYGCLGGAWSIPGSVDAYYPRQ
ncbi:MAG: IS66 family insertion sequence element accessory protein TnpB [Saprospirales bacterium]|nr:IS66 family insertion sequence element accessory protein TnpB [Saprospirales bacterium]